MNTELINSIAKYVEQHIGEFHRNRIAKLQSVNLKELLSRKNPYLFKAKNIVTAGGMVESLASATMSSAEESIFGNWMEGVAMFVAEQVYAGYKSSAEGIDLEFDKEGVHYFVSVKSGPSWSNSTSMKKQKEQFAKARRVFNTSRKTVPTMCIEGCCYGNDNKGYNDSDHKKYCGEKFWTLISGEPTLFVDIIEPLGFKSKEKNEEYFVEYGRMINKFTQEFIQDYCNADGDIEWDKIVRLNAAIKAPKKLKRNEYVFLLFDENSKKQDYTNASEAILSVIKKLMDGVMDNVLFKHPFIAEDFSKDKPLYAALVPNEIWKGSHFERRFTTPFGKAWQSLAVAVGKTYYGQCGQEVKVEGLVGKESLRRIQEVLNKLETRELTPDWNEELKYILDGGGEPVPVAVNCDILATNKDTGKTYAFELKGPLPNSDQTKVSKEKMFKLLAMQGHPVDSAFFALPYNPYRLKENYSWSLPARWFDMKHDPCVLIGEETWDRIGGEGTYQFFIDEVNKLGKHYKDRIYREYLCINPPEGFDFDTLR